MSVCSNPLYPVVRRNAEPPYNSIPVPNIIEPLKKLPGPDIIIGAPVNSTFSVLANVSAWLLFTSKNSTTKSYWSGFTGIGWGIGTMTLW